MKGDDPQEDPQQPMVFEWDGVSPPFTGTAWVSPDLITPEDPTALSEAPEYRGIEYRNVPDRRVIYVHGEEQIPHEVHVYRSRYIDDVEVEVFVNTEFEIAEANALARRYASMLGQMPMMVRATVRSMVIHDGTICGEAGRTSRSTPAGRTCRASGRRSPRRSWRTRSRTPRIPWCSGRLNGQRRKSWTAWRSRSTRRSTRCVRTSPRPFLLYAVLRLLPERLPAGVADAIEQAIPNRLAYLDALPWEGKWCPVILEDCAAEAQE